ncbi:CopG family ribbon-helix-helix protein [Salsuginibacillus kocurii]|uniref:CopG family ribbon-helix-helix protein n=1 Tax=Salsuginibacillus kocurii TaxID=427078 RepID=UPI00037EEB29|nr:hypothetical protein [Salsuginibacillus kocurii]
MSQGTTKQIVINLPTDLLCEVDGMIQGENVDRSEFIYQAAEGYISERKKSRIREAMEQGYREMANINLNIAAESFLVEEEAGSKVDGRIASGV